jgi:ABC-type multidrug transport system ATPase subunit
LEQVFTATLQRATIQVIITNVMLLVVGRECKLDKVTPTFWTSSRHLTTTAPLFCVSVAYPASVLSGSFKGNDVSVSAQISPGSYGMVIGIIVFFSLTFPGAVLSSAFLPGNKISHFGVTLLLLVACASPAILFSMNFLDYEFMGNCLGNLERNYNSGSGITLDNAGSDFVEWVGWQVTPALNMLCTPAYVSILPQIGLFNTLLLSLMSQIVISTEPEEYLDDFISQLKGGGASCSGSQCKFEYATQLYAKNIGFMFVGALLLSILGLVMATLFIYPTSAMIRAKHFVRNLLNCRRNKQRQHYSGNIEEMEGLGEMEEVITERHYVHSVMQPFFEQPDDLEANESPTPHLSRTYIESNRDKLPPVVMHKLRKVFPPLGGAPEKVALASLDLHVPRGEVLGLLGKNGAGKTTALNILAGIHSASSGIGLISGYDVETELNSVYERLGNCPQFDCVWKDQSVQRHLEFYARLKGIDDPNAALDMANAVGLGAPGVYTRQSGALSGGMRRRLSIAVSLLGSPNTLLLDEPTTGLDPSTRIEIWTLLSSFATPERAIIITTHMMLEADALCNRIAIVAKGALKVVGTQVSSILTETLHRVLHPLSLFLHALTHSFSYKM